MTEKSVKQYRVLQRTYNLNIFPYINFRNLVNRHKQVISQSSTLIFPLLCMNEDCDLLNLKMLKYFLDRRLIMRKIFSAIEQSYYDI